MYPPGSAPGGHAKTALPVCEMYSSSASFRASRVWRVTNAAGSRWKLTKKSPASSSPRRSSIPSVNE